MDVSESQSVSLDIELDSDIYPASVILNQDSENDSISLFSFNSPPPCAWDLIPEISENICVTRLPLHGLEEVELCLNPPSRGSMLNWEYVAAEFGFPNSKIMHLRMSGNPTADVLREVFDRPLRNLLNVLAKINRVDALLSLQPYLENIVRIGDNTQTLSSGVSSGNFIRPNASSISVVASNQKFILITHHESITSIALRKNYKWFLKNLRKQAERISMLTFDIEDYLETSCQLEGLHTLFADASYVICVFTNDYMGMLKSNGSQQAVTVKQYLHKLMNGEFIEQGNNQRFCAVVFQDEGLMSGNPTPKGYFLAPSSVYLIDRNSYLKGTGRDMLPLGWAKSTLVYEFPANHVQLFHKLFAKG